jgi:uncharacterized protein with HEPN domain
MRDYRLYLDDILEAVKRIEKYVAGQDPKKFKRDLLLSTVWCATWKS